MPGFFVVVAHREYEVNRIVTFDIINQTAMDLQTEKLDIIKWIAGVSEGKIIKQFTLLKEMHEEMASVKLDPLEKQAIDVSLDSIKAGRIKSHEEVTEAAKKKYPHLF